MFKLILIITLFSRLYLSNGRAYGTVVVFHLLTVWRSLTSSTVGNPGDSWAYCFYKSYIS